MLQATKEFSEKKSNQQENVNNFHRIRNQTTTYILKKRSQVRCIENYTKNVLTL